jgi:hypothetical protein
VNLTKPEIGKATNNRSPIANDLFAQERSTIISKSPIVKAINDRSPIVKTTNKRRAAFSGRKSKQPYCSWTETLKVIEQIERDRKNSLFNQSTTNKETEQ